MLKSYAVTLASGVDVEIEVNHMSFGRVEVYSAYCGEYLEHGEVSSVAYGTWDVHFDMVPSLKCVLTVGREADVRILAVIHAGHCAYVFLED